MNLVDNDFLQDNCLFKIIEKSITQLEMHASDSYSTFNNLSLRGQQSPEVTSHLFQPNNMVSSLKCGSGETMAEC